MQKTGYPIHRAHLNYGLTRIARSLKIVNLISQPVRSGDTLQGQMGASLVRFYLTRTALAAHYRRLIRSSSQLSGRLFSQLSALQLLCFLQPARAITNEHSLRSSMAGVPWPCAIIEEPLVRRKQRQEPLAKSSLFEYVEEH
jgi:hypothetical protein